MFVVIYEGQEVLLPPEEAEEKIAALKKGLKSFEVVYPDGGKVRYEPPEKEE